MAAGVCKVDRIIITIAIQVQAVDGFGVEVGCIIGRDESAPFGGVIPGVAVVQAGVAGMYIAMMSRRWPFAAIRSLPKPHLVVC